MGKREKGKGEVKRVEGSRDKWVIGDGKRMGGKGWEGRELERENETGGVGETGNTCWGVEGEHGKVTRDLGGNMKTGVRVRLGRQAYPLY